MDDRRNERWSIESRRASDRGSRARLLARRALIGVLLCLSGCATVPWPFTTRVHDAEQAAAKSSAAAPKSSATAATANAEALKEVMAELQEAGVDPAARDELIANLKQTDPSHWSMVLQEYRAAAAYRRRGEARAKERQEAESPEVANFKSAPRDEIKNSTHLISRRRTQPETNQTDSGDSRQQFAARDDYLKPLANVPAATIADNHLALAPEPSMSGVTSTAFTAARGTTDKPGEATAISIEPPPLSARLASSREEKPVLVGGTNGAPTSTALTPGSSPKGRGEADTPLTQSEWQAHLAAAIRSMESTATPGSNGENDIALQARLRMLYMLAGRREDAMRPLPSAPKATQDYWNSQINGLSTWMDSERTPDPARREAETKRILSGAAKQIGDTAPLAVRNLNFCTAVKYFGSFDAVKSVEFAPGQKVLLYAEVENFRTEQSPKGFHTAVKFSWQILDGRGNRMGDYAAVPCEDHSLTPKHEFFLTKLFFLPDTIASGHYTLQFTVEDTLGHKVGQSSTELTIK
jgi:hypothetical protein